MKLLVLLIIVATIALEVSWVNSQTGLSAKLTAVQGRIATMKANVDTMMTETIPTLDFGIGTDSQLAKLAQRFYDDHDVPGVQQCKEKSGQLTYDFVMSLQKEARDKITTFAQPLTAKVSSLANAANDLKKCGSSCGAVANIIQGAESYVSANSKNFSPASLRSRALSVTANKNIPALIKTHVVDETNKCMPLKDVPPPGPVPGSVPSPAPGPMPPPRR